MPTQSSLALCSFSLSLSLSLSIYIYIYISSNPSYHLHIYTLKASYRIYTPLLNYKSFLSSLFSLSLYLSCGVSSWCNGKSDGLQNRSKRVRTPVALLRSLSGKYSYERYELPYPPSYGLNSITTILLGE